MNYTDLVKEIKSYVENDFVDDDINTFIRGAEQRIYNTVQLPDLRKTVTSTIFTATIEIPAPADWLSTFSIAAIAPSGEYVYLLNKDVNFLREAYPNPTTQGVPRYYAIIDDTKFLIAPATNANYVIEHNYFYYPESIVTAGTTWLGDNFDSALLYGAMLEAYTFMKGEKDVMDGYQKRYDEAMALLKQLGDGKDRRDAYRSGQFRMDVV